MSSGKRWYVVHTQPHAERKAVAHLERQGFDPYLPQYLKSRKHARKVENVPCPLFSRYLFVAVDLAVQRWRCIQSTVGVVGLVCSGGNPLPVSDAVVGGLKQREDESGFVPLARRPLFKPGDSVRVEDGVFASSLGLFEGIGDDERATILLDLLGRKVRVTLDAGYVSAA